jgi:hypothetical protein
MKVKEILNILMIFSRKSFRNINNYIFLPYNIRSSNSSSKFFSVLPHIHSSMFNSNVGILSNSDLDISVLFTD